MPKEQNNPAVEETCARIEAVLSESDAYRKVEDGLYVVKQGSAYVMVNVIPWGEDRAVVRCAAQVLVGVDRSEELAWGLLKLNSLMRFGSFAFVPDGNRIYFIHAILGGETLDAEEIVATVGQVALVADEYDDKIAAVYGGRRMQDLLEEQALSHVLTEGPEDFSFHC